MATDSNSPWLTKMLAISILLFGAGTVALVLFGDSTPDEQAATTTESAPVLSAEDRANFETQLAAFEQTAPKSALSAMKTDVASLPSDADQSHAAALAQAAEVEQQARAQLAEREAELARRRAADDARKEQERLAKAAAEKAAAEKHAAEKAAAEKVAAEKAAAAKVAAQMVAAEKARSALPSLPPSLPPPAPQKPAPAPAAAPVVTAKQPAPQAAAAEAPRQEPKVMWEYLPPAEEVEQAPSTAAIVGTQPGFQLASPPAQSSTSAMPWAQAQRSATPQFTPTLEYAQGNSVWVRTSPTKTEKINMGERHPTLGILRSIRGEEAKFDNAIVKPGN